jgi:hypothetical protein
MLPPAITKAEPEPAPSVVESGSELSSEALLARAADYLWSKQAADGGWHSETYGLLRSGQALTPFILHSLAQLPPAHFEARAESQRRALDFIHRHVNDAGVLGFHDTDLLEYPNYSTAYALRCLLTSNQESDRNLASKMAEYLAGQQLGPARGFAKDHPAFGGWGFGGRATPEHPGHMDLAHTRRVLEALHEFDQTRSRNGNRLADAIVFLSRVQNERIPGTAAPDGGFFFSTIVLQANKGRTPPGSEQFQSYATATCDGILSLLAAGVPAADERVQSAADWLKRHPRWDYPDGIPTNHPEPWGEALFFYHLAVRAEVYDRLQWPGDWQAEVVRALSTLQRADGSFVNHGSPLMKEDDPLLATTLALIALVHADSSR